MISLCSFPERFHVKLTAMFFQGRKEIKAHQREDILKLCAEMTSHRKVNSMALDRRGFVQYSRPPRVTITQDETIPLDVEMLSRDVMHDGLIVQMKIPSHQEICSSVIDPRD